MIRTLLRRAALLALILLPSPAFAGEGTTARDSVVRTRHDVTIGDRRVAYTATTGYLTLLEEDGQARARIFYVAYTAEGTERPEARPVTFSFNGGPGSSSVWLHLGVLGPRRVATEADGGTLPPPYRLEPNDVSWLDLTDLVFIDPVSTGYSRAVEESAARDFHGVEEDIASVGDFIRRWLGEEQRWASPKFLIGESYGTTRAAGLADHLQNRYGMGLNGVILVSAITQFQTARFDAGNDLPYALFLPTYAATARHHGRLAEPWASMPERAFQDSVEAFALGRYWLDLARGDALTGERRARTTARLAGFTGLEPAWVERADLRVDIHRFTKELLRDERLVVGRFDSRFTGVDMDANDAYGERDPSYQPAIQGAFSTLINDYLGRELDFRSPLPYEVLTGRVRPWDWSTRNAYLNTADRLRSAMERNPHLQVWIVNGLYDLATPYFATEYTVAHMGLSPDARRRVRMTEHPAGHMMYLVPDIRARMHEEAAGFYRAAVPQAP
jgi:carboxypeptidase C (cathepsin A)